MQILIRYGNEIFVSNSTNTLSGQWNVETKYGLAATSMGILHGLSPAWRKAANIILRQNYKGQVTYNADIPLTPNVDDHIQSFVMITDNNMREVAVSFEAGKANTAYGQNGFIPLIRERVIGPSRYGQVVSGHWQHYNPKFTKGTFDRTMSILAHACKTPEEFFRRWSYGGAPNLGSFHAFEIIELQDIAGAMNHELNQYEIISEFKEISESLNPEDEAYKTALRQYKYMEHHLITMNTKLQEFLDERLDKVAAPVDLAL